MTGVEVDADLNRAKVYLSSYADEGYDRELLGALDDYRKPAQAEIGRSARLRKTPEVVFLLDPAVRAGARIDDILASLPETASAPTAEPEHDRGAADHVVDAAVGDDDDRPGCRRRARTGVGARGRGRVAMSGRSRRPDSGAVGCSLVDKPPGCTSHDVVDAARRVFGTRKVGHAGTLDPDATGVLVLGVGAGTKLLQFVTGADKNLHRHPPARGRDDDARREW